MTVSPKKLDLAEALIKAGIIGGREIAHAVESLIDERLAEAFAGLASAFPAPVPPDPMCLYCAHRSLLHVGGDGIGWRCSVYGCSCQSNGR